MLANSTLNDSRKNSGRRLVAWLLAFGLVMLASPLAMAKKRVVVLGFDGPQSGKAEAAVVAAVKKKHTVVSAGQYSKAQKKLKIKKLSDKNVARIAAEIQVDAIVTGKIKRKGAKWSLTLVVREGVSGKVKGQAKIALRAPRIDARAKTDIAAKVLPLVNKTRAIAGASSDDGGDDSGDDTSDEVAMNDDGDGEAEADEVVPPKKGNKGKPAADDETPAEEPIAEDKPDDEAVPGVDDEKTVAQADESDGDVASSVTASTGDSDGGSIAGGKYARHGAFHLELGMSAVGRTLTFTSQESLLAEQQPNGYEGAIVPGGMISGELYPLAFSKPDGMLAGIGLTFVFDRVFVLKSRYAEDEFDTTQQRFGIGVRYRLPLGKRATLPTIHVGIGYSQLSFIIDNGATAIGLPDVEYAYLDPGVGMRLPLGTAKLALLVDARYLLVLETGEMGNADNYGSGAVAGLDIDAGVEFRPIPRLPIHLGVR